MFIDRKDAGEKLSVELEKYKNDNAIILAVPRGGVITAYETIKKYGFDWDLVIPRKIGAPQYKELAIGAVSADGTYFVDEYYVKRLGVSQKYIDREVASQTKEIKERLKKYRGIETTPDLRDKTVIIIDDGIATGFTILAAVKSVKNQGAAKTILAVPVAPEETVMDFRDIVDEVICLLVPDDFSAVGQYYENFRQVEDEEVFATMNNLKLRGIQ
jgi:putative phosphoribosyl transferase